MAGCPVAHSWFQKVCRDEATKYPGRSCDGRMAQETAPPRRGNMHGIRETEVSCLRLERSAAVPGFEMPTRF